MIPMMISDVELEFLHHLLNRVEGSDLLQTDVGEDSVLDNKICGLTAFITSKGFLMALELL
jgi:hypothetical protein